jgi:hypothetical protein
MSRGCDGRITTHDTPSSPSYRRRIYGGTAIAVVLIVLTATGLMGTASAMGMGLRHYDEKTTGVAIEGTGIKITQGAQALKLITASERQLNPYSHVDQPAEATPGRCGDAGCPGLSWRHDAGWANGEAADVGTEDTDTKRTQGAQALKLITASERQLNPYSHVDQPAEATPGRGGDYGGCHSSWRRHDAGRARANGEAADVGTEDTDTRRTQGAQALKLITASERQLNPYSHVDQPAEATPGRGGTYGGCHGSWRRNEAGRA